MGKLASMFGAATLAMSFAVGSLAPAIAAPQFGARAPIETSSGIVNVQWSDRQPRWRRDYRPWDQRRGVRESMGDNGPRYYRGHRGYRHYRHGYRRHNGWWYPAGAFFAGAIIGSAINGPRYYDPPRRYRSASSAHVRWCYNRYRSYREWDNTYQPYNGPRRECYSPYRY